MKKIKTIIIFLLNVSFFWASFHIGNLLNFNLATFSWWQIPYIFTCIALFVPLVWWLFGYIE